MKLINKVKNKKIKKNKLDIVLNERQCEIEKGMVFDAEKNLLKTLVGIDGDRSSSDVNLSDLSVEKMEKNVKEHNLKKQFKEKTFAKFMIFKVS